MSCATCEREMRWPQCKNFVPQTFRKNVCMECAHPQSDHGAGGASAAPAAEKKSDAPPKRRSPSPVRRRSPSPPKRRSPSPPKRRSPSPVRRRSPSPERARAATATAPASDVPATMKCVVAKSGSAEVETRATPEPAKDEVLVRVHAAGLNQADLLQVAGKYPVPPGAPDTLGLELSGEVVRAGADAKKYWGTGDRVCGLLSGGGYAEYAVVHADHLIELPERMSHQEGAGVAEGFLTAYQALFLLADLKGAVARAKLDSGKANVLVWGASGGVGSCAVQLAAKLAGGGTRVFAMASSADKVAYVKGLGADVGLNHSSSDWQRTVSRETNDHGIDIMVDLVGAAHFSDNLACMATDGCIVMLGMLSGSQTPSQTDLGVILRKRVTIKGSTLRARDVLYKGVLTQSFVEDYGDLLAKGTLKVHVDKSFPLSQAADAHAYMAQGKHKGKIVLTIPAAWIAAHAAATTTTVVAAAPKRADVQPAKKLEPEAPKQRTDSSTSTVPKVDKKPAIEQPRADSSSAAIPKTAATRREPTDLGASSTSVGGAKPSASFKPCKSDWPDEDRSAISSAEAAVILAMVNATLKKAAADGVHGAKAFGAGFATVDALTAAFADGVLPCVHLGALLPKDIDLRAVNVPAKDKFDREENFTLFLGAGRAAGATYDRSVTKTSLPSANADTVLAVLWQSIKSAISLTFVREKSIRDDLANEAHVKMETVRDDWGANKICWAWLNLMIKRGGGRQSVKSFVDLADCQALGHVVNAIWGAAKTPADAEALVALCASKGVRDVACAEGVAAGHGRTLYSLVGALFVAFLKGK